MIGHFTQQSLRALEFARDAAKSLNHEYVGTEHLLLGVSRADSVTLSELGVTPAAIENKVAAFVQAGPDNVTLTKLPFTPRARNIIEAATKMAGDGDMDDVHLVAAMHTEASAVCGAVLRDCGITADAIQRLLAKGGAK